MINPNKLFPRLPIRVKLVVAFALLVSVPLLVTGAFGTRETLRQIETSARTTLHHELATTSDRTEHFLMSAEEDLVYFSEAYLRPLAENRGDSGEVRAALAEFLDRKPRFFQIRLLTPEGDPIVAMRAGDRPENRTSVAGGAYYAFRARGLAPDRIGVMAVEVRDERSGGETRAVPAIAIVRPLQRGDGELAAIAVAEVYAARLFQALEEESSDLGGTTGLVDADGQYLYHSERKRDWNTLLATRPDANLAAEFGEEPARRMLAGEAGTLRVDGERLVSFRRLRLSGPDGRPLFAYRAVPVSAYARPARRFLQVVGLGGFLVLGVAMALAVVAATQFTRPIYQLREEARKVASGEFGERPRIETNDELEDLAEDFGFMADRLREHRQHLEELVAERTSALTEAHAELAEILAHTEDAIIRLDRPGRVRVWNRGAEKMFGYRREEAVGRSFETLLAAPETRGGPAPEPPSVEPLLDHRAARWRQDGEPLEVSLSRTAIQGTDGEVVGFTVIVRDETRQRVLERQMLRSERLAAAGRLAAGVVHEINNPIGIIVNRIECLDVEIDERCGDCFARADLAVVRQQAERVGVVARRLLTLAREESEARRPVDLHEVIGGVTVFMRPELRKRDLRLETALVPDLPAVVASPHAIETVLLNLLLNAMDASAPGGTIGVSTRLARAGRWVELEVRDTGTGIPPDQRERIFEPFYTTKVKPRGTGLGLAVCQGVVQAHGGEIRVASEPGAGSRFTIVLPLDGGNEA